MYPTPHIQATPADFAETVLMPGDPKRSAFIAKTFLENPVLINDVRGVQGYTGVYKGKRISVMASGMGMPSIGIYSYELFNFFGIENIIRVGSAGGLTEKVHIRDVVIGMGACTNSNYASQFNLPGTFAPIASYKLLRPCADIAEKKGLNYHVGNLLSSDPFYNDEADLPAEMRSTPLWNKMGVLAVEMETAALYMNAARAGKNALAICTVSDHLITGEATSAEDREKTFTDMMTLALDTAVAVATRD
ncbi:MAG: purine-nucleoside phosphorylase [Clostridia bacterium]|nr:purine-nucleoside phosphorylase [Clostridia bacterium]